MIYQNLGNITYDPADPEDNSFFPDYHKHMGVLEDVDRRLASLFSQGLDECHNMEHFFKASLDFYFKFRHSLSFNECNKDAL